MSTRIQKSDYLLINQQGTVTIIRLKHTVCSKIGRRFVERFRIDEITVA